MMDNKKFIEGYATLTVMQQVDDRLNISVTDQDAGILYEMLNRAHDASSDEEEQIWCQNMMLKIENNSIESNVNKIYTLALLDEDDGNGELWVVNDADNYMDNFQQMEKLDKEIYEITYVYIVRKYGYKICDIVMHSHLQLNNINRRNFLELWDDRRHQFPR